jgi:hypothetical protein
MMSKKATEQELIAKVEEAFAAFDAADAKADAAFRRYFAKLHRGERTNAAQASRLANETNYLSTDVHVALGELFSAYPDTTYEIREGWA